MRILVMGLPGSGKTTFASRLAQKFGDRCLYLNADEIRKQYDDWDFSIEGRLRQAQRMRSMADTSDKEFVIADFVAPLPEMRDIYDADFVVWMDTIDSGRFEDTNKIFVKPDNFGYRICSLTGIDYFTSLTHWWMTTQIM